MGEHLDVSFLLHLDEQDLELLRVDHHAGHFATGPSRAGRATSRHPVDYLLGYPVNDDLAVTIHETVANVRHEANRRYPAQGTVSFE